MRAAVSSSARPAASRGLGLAPERRPALLEQVEDGVDRCEHIARQIALQTLLALDHALHQPLTLV